MEEAYLKKIDSFFKPYKHLFFKKGEIIIFAQDIPKGIYYILSGYVRSFVSAKSGKDFTARIYKQGDFFSHRTVYKDLPTSHSYQALSEVEVICAPKKDFVFFLKSNPDIVFELNQILLGSLNLNMRRLETIIIGSAEGRIAAILIFLANSVGENKDNITVIPINLIHQNIADMTGLTRETASIEIEKMEAKKIIIHEKKLFYILDRNKLYEIADEAKLF